MQSNQSGLEQYSLFTDIRFLKIAGQAIFLIVAAIMVAVLVSNVFGALAERNLSPNFTFLENRAGFSVADSSEFYDPDDSYFRAFQAGLINTFRVIILGIAATTVIGILFGIFLLSTNFLVRTLARIYVEILRNTPLLVQLYVWFFVIIASLPQIRDPINIPSENPLMVMTNRGVYLASIILTPRGFMLSGLLLIGMAIAFGYWIWSGRVMSETGRDIPRSRNVLILLGAILIFGGTAAAILNPVPENVTIIQDSATINLPLEEALEEDLLTREEEAFYSSRIVTAVPPERRGLRYEAGTTFTSSYLALLLGLVIYTSAFIAEIVRAGIQAVQKGQIEAARALGMPRSKTLRLVILPQALRIIIPPLGNQYLNLAKNSSLAIAISYTDVFQVSNTIINQTGQTVTVFTMVMATYLAISLVISFIMNQINSRFQLVSR